MLNRDLGHMQQCINALFQLYKCTKIGHTGNLTCHNISLGILLRCSFPWIVGIQFHRKGNLGADNIFDHHIHLVTNLEQFLWILYTSPAHLGDMQQTIRTALLRLEELKLVEVRRGRAGSRLTPLGEAVLGVLGNK